MRNLYNIFVAELNKYWIEIRTYYPDHVAQLVTTYIFFMGFFFVFSGDSFGVAQTEKTLYGFLLWFFSVNVITESSATISSEKQIGTFEQLMMQPCGISIVLAARTICWTIVSLVQCAFLLTIIVLTTSISINISTDFIAIVILTLIGLSGFGFLLGGLTVLYTKTASFGSIIQYFLLFFSGALFSVEAFPPVLKLISNGLPLTQGVKLLQMLVDNTPLLVGDWLTLLGVSIAYCAVGLLCMHLVINRALRLGVSKGY